MLKKYSKIIISSLLCVSLTSCSLADTFINTIDQIQQEGKVSKITDTSESVIPNLKNCFYLSQLSGVDLAFVTEVYEGIMNFEDEIDIQLVFKDKERPFQLLELLQYDCPEIYQFTTNGTSSATANWIDNINELVSVNIDYLLTKEEYEQSLPVIESTLQQLADQANSLYSTNFEKELYVYDYIVDTCSYDENSVHNSSPYGVLIDHTAACFGLSRTMQWAMSYLNIPCLTVGGQSKSDDTGHAWNVIQMDDGNYYSVDVTADTERINTEGFKMYLYMNVTDDELGSKYNIRTSLFNIPQTASIDENYYVMTGNYIYSGQDVINEVSTRFISALNNGLSECRIRFESQEDFQYVIDNITEIYNDCLNQAGHPSIQTSYSASEDQRVIYFQMI